MPTNAGGYWLTSERLDKWYWWESLVRRWEYRFVSLRLLDADGNDMLNRNNFNATFEVRDAD